MKKNLLKAVMACWCLFACLNCFAQKKIEGAIKANPNDTIRLFAYNGLDEQKIAEKITNANGHFVLSYPATQTGIGVLRISNKGEILIALTDADIQFTCTDIKNAENMTLTKGAENQAIHEYLLQEKGKGAVKGALGYLNANYAADELLKSRLAMREELKKEIAYFDNIQNNLYAKIGANSYFTWYFKTRNDLAALGNEIQKPTNNLKAAVDKLDAVDFNDKRYWSSGLFKNIIYLHLQGLAKLYTSNEKALYDAAVQKDIDHLTAGLQNSNAQLFNGIADFMFNYFEQSSLYDASEYLSLKMLAMNDCNACTINTHEKAMDVSLTKRFEQYKLLKAGLIAPNIVFDKKIKDAASLKEVNSKYKLVVFGASWCPKCKEEIPQLTAAYADLQQKGVEVIFISLDKETAAYADFTKGFKFISYCDFNAWQSKPVKDYYVFSTPTMYLLDKDLTILLKPVSINHINQFLAKL